jgi:hypothetical protein
MDFPKLIVFDFHGTLSLRTGTSKYIGNFEKTLEKDEFDDVKINNLKNALKPFKTKTWYDAMVKSNINPKIMMPTLDDVNILSDLAKKNGSILGIATMGENEDFIIDMLNYCFSSLGKKSPFDEKAIIGVLSMKESKVKSKTNNDKLPHIFIMLERLGLNFPLSSIVLIDDSGSITDYMSSIGMKTILVDDYFRMKDWYANF